MAMLFICTINSDVLYKAQTFWIKFKNPIAYIALVQHKHFLNINSL